jgi:hypothetical protein
MLKLIINLSIKLVIFIEAVRIELSQPQLRHVARIADALIVCEAQKNLSELYRLFVEAPDPTNAADCLRVSPWTAENLRTPLHAFEVRDLIARAEAAGEPKIIWVSIDDSLAEKDKNTHHLDLVDFHHDHLEGARKKAIYKNGAAYVVCKIQIGPFSYTFDLQPYLRERTVRRINRQRPKGQRIHFRSKYKIAREVLVELKKLLPKDYQVYALFDSWYASGKLIKFCHRQGWYVICAIKSNRCLNGKTVHEWARQLRHQRYTKMRVFAADGTPTEYLVRSIRGHIKGVPFEVCVFISRRHHRDKNPKYFLCTDLSLSAQIVLNWYKKRWPCEVDNFYLKTRLGLGDFRVRSYEAGNKWFAIVLLAFAYLEFRLNEEKGDKIKSLADVIRSHRKEHARELLVEACRQAIELGATQPVLQRFLGEEALVLSS